MDWFNQIFKSSSFKVVKKGDAKFFNNQQATHNFTVNKIITSSFRIVATLTAIEK
jgi:hypothetical protein